MDRYEPGSSENIQFKEFGMIFMKHTMLVPTQNAQYPPLPEDACAAGKCSRGQWEPKSGWEEP